MLYIFQVDTGSMMTFEMNLALESVSHLKEFIERACNIPPDKQVLLVSGGECLDPSARVCSYAAGTDTNPIFLFSKSTIENISPPSPSIDYGSDMDLKEQVETSLAMPATYNTVVVRTQLAQQFYELAREQTRTCERLVHDQHLQQQGWAAVVANLEDSVSVFRARGEAFEHSFQQHLESRSQYIHLLENFTNVLGTLSKIPILPGLLANATESMNGPEEKEKAAWSSGQTQQPVQDNSSSAMSTAQVEDETEAMAVSKKSSGSGNSNGSGSSAGNSAGVNAGESRDDNGGNETSSEEKTLTLLQWISTKDNQNTLGQMVEQCRRGLEQFDERVQDMLHVEVENALESANKHDMKEIKGLEERLYGLEQLMFETKRVVQEQNDLATAFHKNQARANNLGDASILPDLCASHSRQLVVMLKNHHHLRDIKRRCNRAKEELSINLYHRLRWIMYVENRMCDVAAKLMIYHESLKRLRKLFEVIRQIQMAPQMYMCAVGEVVRRRSFSQAFLTWAGELSSQLQAVYSEEMARRKDFQSRFEGHFLNTLFPGMEDRPPSFATQAPLPFDVNLPKLSKEDWEHLKMQLPTLAMSLSIPDLGHLADMFLNKSVTGTLKPDEKEGLALEDRLVEAVTAAGLGSTLDPTLLQPPDVPVANPTPPSLPLKDDRGFESETDTEDFEKVGQSPVDAERTGVALPSTITAEVGVHNVVYQDAGIQCDSRRMPLQSRSSGKSGDSFSMSLEKDLSRNSLVDVGVQCDSETDHLVTFCDSESVSEAPTLSTSSSLYPTTDSGIQCDTMVGSCLRTSSSTLSQTPVQNLSSEIACSCPSLFPPPRLTAQVGVQCILPSSFNVDRSWPIRSSRSQSRAPAPASAGSGSGSHTDAATQCSSPSLGTILAPAESLMDDSMPSSLTESNSLKSHTAPDIDRQIHDAQTLLRLLQDNLGTAQVQLKHARANLDTVGRVARQATESLRSELEQMRGQVVIEQDAFLKLLDTFRLSWEQLLDVVRTTESAGRALDMQLEHERRIASEKDDLIRTLTQSVVERSATVEQLEASLRERFKAEEEQRAQTEHLQRRLEEAPSCNMTPESTRCVELEERLATLEKDRNHCEELQRRLDNIAQGKVGDITLALNDQRATLQHLHEQALRQRLALAEEEKDKALQDLSEKLSKEHQSQLENLRSRFRLMATSMDRSPSESNLEKIEIPRGSKPEVDTESIIRTTKQKVQEEWEVKLQSELRSLRIKLEAERQVWFNEAVRHIMAEKDRTVDKLTRRESILQEECLKHQETIRRLTHNSRLSESRAEEESAMCSTGEADATDISKSQLTLMGASAAIVTTKSGGRDVGASSEPHSMNKNPRFSSSQTERMDCETVSCVKGETVLVRYDENYKNYVIAQDSNILCFVHYDSLESLGLTLTDDPSNRPSFEIGVVVDKEYCHARKSKNRYNVPKGTKFYRVKVSPVNNENMTLKNADKFTERHQQQLQQLQMQRAELPHHQRKDSTKSVEPSSVESTTLSCVMSEHQSGNSDCSLPEVAPNEPSH